MTGSSQKEKKRAYDKARRALLKGEIAEEKRRYYTNNKDRILAYTHDWYRKNKERISAASRRRYFLRKYGMTQEEHEKLTESQDGMCAICDVKPPGNNRHESLVVDHCHINGHVRGLLCHNCNKAIGLLQDSTTLLQRAADYLANNIRWMGKVS